MLALTGYRRLMIQMPMDARDSFIPSCSVKHVSENCDLAVVLDCFSPPVVVSTIKTCRNRRQGIPNEAATSLA
jgi:hypothetical protein